ncbi:CAP domain-containing protein [Lacinutrix sp. 5H-3-7-4]|uniref:CAP domain-containing protein n=1 Tax=Lacinutrix sp. (strain 5H-3-7-4) TaxID=983544 RepID=UPI00020A3E6E|nr:CAP domain-containing protein [Lacinutrix sp. 5H-3-7-4]AEH02498.1 SCP-like extracellular [Lacinutrix sp. 5H-3-7-4]
MKTVLNLLFIALILVTSTSCSSDSSEEFSNEKEFVVIPESKTIEIEILELINEYRIANGFNSLAPMDAIKGQAFSHSDYMVETNNVSHDNFYSRKAYLINNAGAKTVTENVAYGFTNARSVVDAWLNSEGHKANIEGDFTNFEVSAEQNDEGKWYYTNIFINK